MQSLSISKPIIPELFTCCSPPLSCRRRALAFCPPLRRRLSPLPQSLAPFRRRRRRPPPPPRSSPSAELSTAEEEWLKKLPDKKKPLYSHSLPCIEAWLKNLGFYQSREDRAVWFVEKPDWHAQLSLDITDLFISIRGRCLYSVWKNVKCQYHQNADRYLKTGPGNLEKDVERRFSYALSREDIENAILGGP